MKRQHYLIALAVAASVVMATGSHSHAQTAPDASPAHRHAFSDGLSHSYTQDWYSVHVTVADVPEGGIVPLNPNLYVAFPNVVGGDVTPFTSIQWDPGDEELVWRTIHLYALPERVVGVFSTSRVVPRRTWSRIRDRRRSSVRPGGTCADGRNQRNCRSLGS